MLYCFPCFTLQAKFGLLVKPTLLVRKFLTSNISGLTNVIIAVLAYPALTDSLKFMVY